MQQALTMRCDMTKQESLHFLCVARSSEDHCEVICGNRPSSISRICATFMSMLEMLSKAHPES